MNEILGVQKWYSSQCDGDWEHRYGISIETLDNPGWLVKIDLTETTLQHADFPPISIGDGEEGREWISCNVEKGVFVGAGDAGKLQKILSVFLQWAGV